MYLIIYTTIIISVLMSPLLEQNSSLWIETKNRPQLNTQAQCCVGAIYCNCKCTEPTALRVFLYINKWLYLNDLRV
jgi:hypothetical protein